jgi:hypothetical protein
MALPKLETPTYETQIPSGKLVKFRPFLVKEEKVLLMVKESKNTKEIIRAMKQIVESCIKDDTESKTLSYYDIEHLFIHMRARSVGEQIEVMHTCSSCGEDFPFNIDITKVSLSGPIPENTNVMITENIGVSVKPVSPETVAASEANDSDRATIVVKDVIDTVFTDSEVHKFTDFTEGLCQIFKRFWKRLRSFLDVKSRQPEFVLSVGQRMKSFWRESRIFLLKRVA